jgi:hypothetical protein
MARLFTDGAEFGDVLFWDSQVNAWVGAGGYDGDYYYGLTNQYQNATKLLGGNYSEIYLRERVYFPSYYSQVRFPWFRSGSSNESGLYFDGIQRLTAYRGGTVLQTANLVLSTGAWYLVEVHLKISNTVGVFQVKVDGTMVINFSGDTLYGSSTIDNIYYIGAIYLDDLACNDTSGGVDDSWCGDGSMVKVTPDDNGTDNDWTGNDADSVDNYLLVDEFPKDNNTTYVYANTSSSGTQDQYNMSDYDGTEKTITRIYPEARARLSGASATKLKLGILASGGADETDAGTSLSVGAYSRVVGDEYTVNPVDSNPWEEADIDAIEGIIEVE